jgi:hypothetical protein
LLSLLPLFSQISYPYKGEYPKAEEIGIVLFLNKLPDAFSLILCYLLAMIRYESLPKNIREKFNDLTRLLTKDTNIIFAYIFGGLSRGQANPLSDIDLAVYLKNRRAKDYLKLYGNIAKTLGTDEIDLVVLNDAPLSLEGRILQTKKNLVDKAPLLRHKYESMTLRKFFDFKVKEREILRGRYGIG